MTGGRVVFIGLDGATWTVLMPLVRRGLMPNLAGLMESGAWGGLITPMPPSTSPGWPSLLTGKNPGGMGVFWFKDITSDRYNPGLALAGSIRSAMVPEHASRSGKRVCIMGFPVTYPVREVNGIYVSGFLTPPGASDFYYPDGLDASGIDHLRREYDIKGVIDVPRAMDYLDVVMENARTKLETYAEYASRENWDLFMACFAEPDRIQHFLWKYMDEASPVYGEDGADGLREKIAGLFGFIDNAIGEILKAAGDGVYTVIGSDHGFRMTPPKNFHINAFLRDKGYLRSNQYSIKRFLYKNKFIGRGVDELEHPDYSPVNWRKTRAWALPFQCGMAGIFINKPGRFREGTVDGDEADSLIGEIRASLLEVRDQGVQVVKDVLARDEIYSGEFLEYAPDLMVLFHDDYDAPINFRLDLKNIGHFGPNSVWDRRSGGHHERGVYLLNGPGVIQSQDEADIAITSLAPGMLYMTGAGIPAGLDAGPVIGLFDQGFLADNPPAYDGPGESGTYGAQPDGTSSVEDEDLIEEQLKGLGYM